MAYISSISTINDVYSTGGKPFVILGEDLRSYVCKYVNGTPAYKLFKEYLAANLLRLWDIDTPEDVILQVSPYHIVDSEYSHLLNPIDYNIPCFATVSLDNAKDIERYFVSFKNKYHDKNKIVNQANLLKIGLFDLWVANEDRNFNNYNLLLDPEKDNEFRIHAIDHEYIFNSNNLNHDLYQLTEDESLLTSDVCRAMFRGSRKLKGYSEQFIEEFPTYLEACRNNLGQLMESVPDLWKIDKNSTRHYIENQLFNEQWQRDTIANFRQYIFIHLVQ